jgi:hypothetical protein
MNDERLREWLSEWSRVWEVPELRVGESIHVFEDEASDNGRYVNIDYPA